MTHGQPGSADDTARDQSTASPSYGPGYPTYGRPGVPVADGPGQPAPEGERGAEAGEQVWKTEPGRPAVGAGAGAAVAASASPTQSGGLGRPYPTGGFPAAPSAATRTAFPPSVAPPPREAWLPPRRIDAVPGTDFGVVHLDVPPITSGLAVGGLVAGIGSLLVTLLVACFGVAGAGGGWGGWAAGAFAILGVLLGGAGVVLGLVARRQIRLSAARPGVRFTGRGLAVAGVSCGGAGIAVTVLAFLVAVML